MAVHATQYLPSNCIVLMQKHFHFRPLIDRYFENCFCCLIRHLLCFVFQVLTEITFAVPVCVRGGDAYRCQYQFSLPYDIQLQPNVGVWPLSLALVRRLRKNERKEAGRMEKKTVRRAMFIPDYL